MTVDLARVNARVKQLAPDQSDDIGRRLEKEGVRVVRGAAGSTGPTASWSTTADGEERLGRGRGPARHRRRAAHHARRAQPDGERILTWEQVYDLTELPEHLIVVGSGVTGAEFASAYLALGIEVTLVSSRDRVLPGEDADAADRARGRAHPARHERAVEVADGVGDPRRRHRDRHAHRRPHRRRARTASWRSARCRTPPTSGSRRPASTPTTRGFVARRPGLAHHARAACTPPATAPAS